MNVKAVLFLSIFVLGACNREGSPAERKPQPVSFEGQLEPKLVGKWKPDKGDVALTMKQDGSAETRGQVSTPGGKLMTHNSGQWLASGDTVLFRYNTGRGNALGDPTKYAWKVEGDKLTLIRYGTAYRFVYRRSPAK